MRPLVPVFTGHTQTVLGHIIPSVTKPLAFTEHILTLPDGDELFLLYLDNKSDTTLSLYHGLAGDSDADYIRRSADLGSAHSWNLILVNHRKAHPKAKAKKTYHSGRGEDADAVLRWARGKFRNSRQVALGFSLSGSIILNLLTSRYGSEQPDFAIAVNAPLDLANASLRLTQGFSQVYDLRFYFLLKKLIENESDLKLPKWGRTIDVDNLYTSKVNGFKNAEDYYTQCSSLPYLENIKTKTFVLSAHDDPFIDINDYLKAKWSPSTHVTLQKYGGHMGYFNKINDPKYGRRWLDHYLGSVFEKIQESK